jgi:hypothetical protein
MREIAMQIHCRLKIIATFSRTVSSFRYGWQILAPVLKAEFIVAKAECKSNLTLRTVVHSRHYIIDFASLN